MSVVCQNKIWVRVQWIPFLMFIFCLKKNNNKITRSCDSLQIFRRALSWSHLFSTQRRDHLRKNGSFENPALFATFFRSVGVEIGNKKHIIGRGVPFEDCCNNLLNLFFDVSTIFQDKIKQRERSVLEKWGKDVFCGRLFTKLRESAQ